MFWAPSAQPTTFSALGEPAPASTMLRAARGCAVLLTLALAAAVPLALVVRAAAAARRGDALAAPVAELPETVGVSGLPSRPSATAVEEG